MATRADQAKKSTNIERSRMNERARRAKARPQASPPHKPAPAKPNDVKNRRADIREKQTYALEASDGARPSRKSTRASSNRVKADAQLRRRAVRRAHAPEARASRPQAAS
jgi:hypothetical protein